MGRTRLCTEPCDGGLAEVEYRRFKVSARTDPTGRIPENELLRALARGACRIASEDWTSHPGRARIRSAVAWIAQTGATTYARRGRALACTRCSNQQKRSF